MRTAALPNFRKLWGRINGDLEKGMYTMKIHNNFNVRNYDTEKHFVLITSNAIGGKNYFLGTMAIVVGNLAFIGMSVLFYLNRKK